MNTDGLCPVCGLEVESIFHALFNCSVVKETWNLWKECPIDNGVETLDFADVALKLLDAGTPRDMEVLVVVAWANWHNRNLRVFESISQGAEQVWNFAASMLANYKEVAKFCSLGSASCEVSWKKPPARVFKINTNGATIDDGRQSSIGVIIRDYMG